MRLAGWAALRKRVAAMAVLALVIAVLVGGALTAWAGARRADTAMDRFLEYNQPETGYVVSQDGTFDLRQLAAIPQVSSVLAGGYVPLAPVRDDGTVDAGAVGAIGPFLFLPVVGAPDDMRRPYVVHGRLPALDHPWETIVDEDAAQAFHLEVGSSLRMRAFAPEQLDDPATPRGLAEPAGPDLTFTVTGIMRQPSDIDPAVHDLEVVYQGTAEMLLTPAFWDETAGRIATIGDPEHEGGVRLRRGAADGDAFTAAVRALPGGDQVSVFLGNESAAAARRSERAIDLEALTLRGLALVLAAAAVLLTGQAFVRLARAAEPDLAVARTIGFRPSQVALLAALPALVAVATGAVPAVGVAIAASPAMPIGLARRADIDVGVHADWPVLLAGAGLAVVLLGATAVLAGAAAARRAGRPAAAAPGKATLADRAARAGLPVPSLLGLRFAFDAGRDRRATPVRSALAVAATGLVAITAVAVHLTSLDALERSPAAQGWTWDVRVGNPNTDDFGDEDIARMAADPLVAGFTTTADPDTSLQVGGTTVALAGIGATVGGGAPAVVSGRLPSAPGEIALGHHTLQLLRTSVGGQVEGSVDGTTRTFTVVGSIITNPAISQSMTVGDGALVTIDALRELEPSTTVNGFLVDLRPGVGLAQARTEMEPTWGRTVLLPEVPVDVQNVARVRSLPLALALLVATAAAVLLAFTLLVTARRRRRELAVLKSLGLDRRQLSAAMAWQAVALAAGGVVIGVPLGIVGGRLAWRATAEGIGTLLAPRVPLLAITAIAAGAVAVAIAAALVPARTAARTPAAAALRTE